MDVTRITQLIHRLDTATSRLEDIASSTADTPRAIFAPGKDFNSSNNSSSRSDSDTTSDIVPDPRITLSATPPDEPLPYSNEAVAEFSWSRSAMLGRMQTEPPIMPGRFWENISRLPSGSPRLNGIERDVRIACRPFTRRFHDVPLDIFRYNAMPYCQMPDPDYNWCVVIGDFYHKLEVFVGHNSYANGQLDWDEDWQSYKVGVTRFNDIAIADAGAQTIEAMPDKYDIIFNNYQRFALELLDKVCTTGRTRISASLSRYRLQGAFFPRLQTNQRDKESKEVEVAFVEEGPAHFALLENAEAIMIRQTPKVTPEEMKERLEVNQVFIEKTAPKRIRDPRRRPATMYAPTIQEDRDDFLPPERGNFI